ncbi:S-adenosyl-L-methionine-dependent methyltransferase [Xylariaceae sp. FL1019]|nr:S-adenosyl-L-methionine-dependent methyltransferase [Xylariaceae sp. FL1019]
MAKVQSELDKLYDSYTEDFDEQKTEKFIADSERIMRAPARVLLLRAGLGAETKKPFRLLDHGCGTGVVAACLQESVDKGVLGDSVMLCADFSESFVKKLNWRAKKMGWQNVAMRVLDAQKSGLPSGHFSHVTLNFAMHVIPDPEAVAQEAMRVLQPGGIFAFTVWHKDNAGWVSDLRSSFEALPFDAPLPDPVPMAANGRLEWVDPETVQQPLLRCGFEDVRVGMEEHVQRIEDAGDYVKSFGMMKDWMVSAYWSEESKAEGMVRDGLLDGHIEGHLREKYGAKGWDLTWTYITVTGRKPKE